MPIRIFLVLLFPTLLWAADAREEQRIEHLLTTVEALEGAQFIRNGQGHDPAAAGKHLRMKLRRAGGRVQTAEDFIKGCATGSSLSGRPYTIRFADGKVMETAAFLREKLREHDARRS